MPTHRPIIAGAAIAARLAASPASARAAGPLRQIARFDHQVTGVSVAADGRRFVNFPRWTDDAPISVAEVMKDGSLRPYPRLVGQGTETVLADRRLRWPDTLSEGPDGTIYLTASHIQDTSWFTPGAPASITTELFAFAPNR